STQLADQIAERGQVIGLVSDQEIHIVDAERVREQLPDMLVTMPYLHVLVHHGLPFLLAEQIPVRALGERIHDEVLRALAAEERLLLWCGALDVLRRPDDAQKAMAHRRPRAQTRPQRASDLLLQRLDARSKAPEHQVDPDLQTNHRVRERRDLQPGRQRGAELLGRAAALVASLATPRRIQSQRE